MSDPGALAYLALFLGALGLGSVLVPLALRLALRLGVLDQPGGHKGHEQATPYLGGAAIALTTCGALGAGVAFSSFGSRAGDLWVILGALVAVSAVGLADDLRALPPWIKFVAVLLAALGLWQAGVGVAVFDSRWLNASVTLLWIVGITNAMNLMDNMDGLSAGTATIAATFTFLLAVTNDQYLVASLAVTVAGSSLAFLRHNRPPARIFMGDAGSLFIGLMLAVLGVGLRFDGRPESVTVLVPILLLGVPILDTSMVVVTRIVDGRRVTLGHRDHLSHRLRAAGLDVRGAVGVLLGVQVMLGCLALVLSRSSDTLTAWVTAGTAALIVVGGAVVLARVPIDPLTGAARSAVHAE